MENNINYYNYPKYKGIYYKYSEDNNIWTLYRNYITGLVMVYNADYYRIDHCINDFLKKEKELDG